MISIAKALYNCTMSDVTHFLDAADSGDRHAAAEMLPARRKIANAESAIKRKLFSTFMPLALILQFRFRTERKEMYVTDSLAKN